MAKTIAAVLVLTLALVACGESSKPATSWMPGIHTGYEEGLHQGYADAKKFGLCDHPFPRMIPQIYGHNTSLFLADFERGYYKACAIARRGGVVPKRQVKLSPAKPVEKNSAGRPGCTTPGNRTSDSRLAMSRTHGEQSLLTIFIKFITLCGGFVEKGNQMAKSSARTLICLCCMKKLDPIDPESEFQPSDGIICYSRGNYGSCVFDPLREDKQLLFFICDTCLSARMQHIYLIMREEQIVSASDEVFECVDMEERGDRVIGT